MEKLDCCFVIRGIADGTMDEVEALERTKAISEFLGTMGMMDRGIAVQVLPVEELSEAKRDFEVRRFLRGCCLNQTY